MAAVDPREAMIAAMGEDESGWRAPMGYFLPGSPAANDAGMEFRNKRWSTDDVKAMLDKAGYGGERIVLLHPTDQIIYNAFITVAADSFHKVGLNIDEQMVDWGTVVQRRTSKETVDKGGWSIFPAGAPGPEFVDPMLANTLRSPGAKAWFGWPDDPKIEAAYEAWIDAPNDAERHRHEAEFQLAAFQLRADDHAWTVPAQVSVAIERDRTAEGLGTCVLGRRKDVSYSGGRRCAHGRAHSNAAATLSNCASSPGRAIN